MAIRKTFPLDRNKLRAGKLERVLKSPVTGLGLGAGLMLGLALGIGPVGVLGILAVTCLGLKLYWSSQDERVEAEVLSDLIHESNKEQDRALKKSVSDLRKEHRHNYAVTLGRFLLLKQNIEKRLHEDSNVTKQKIKIENLIDQICFEVKDNICAIINIEEKTASILVSSDADEVIETDEVRRKLLTQIVNAYGTLNETYENLEIMLQPGAVEAKATADSIDQMIGRLEQENLIVKNVHQRIAEDMMIDDGILDESEQVEPESLTA